jgi:hypothetical protein
MLNNIIADGFDQAGPNSGLIGDVDCIEEQQLPSSDLIGQLQAAERQNFKLPG